MRIILPFIFAMTFVNAFPGMFSQNKIENKGLMDKLLQILKIKLPPLNPKKIKPKVLQLRLPVWKPKENNYNPSKVDWSSVISGCKATCRYDKRLCNFYVRAAAHDSLSISEGSGGADGSLLLTQDELRRKENNYDNFAFLLSKNALALAQRYDTSVADIIAVCGAVATEFFGGPTIIKYDPIQPFLVGRHDRTEPNPANQLANPNINTTTFNSFAQSKNLSLEEMTALMGSHTLLDEKGCMKKDKTYCNPRVSKCDDLLIYDWSNIYYKETCSPTIRINNPKALSTIPLQTREFFIQQDMCRFTSSQFRQRQLDMITQELPDLGDPTALVTGDDVEFEDVTWYDVNTNISKKWTYTVHDAWMGSACQGILQESTVNTNIQTYMNNFNDNVNEWNTIYTRAYKKMVNTGAIWNKSGSFSISGLECHSGYNSPNSNVNCKKCNVYNCPPSCKCKTAFNETESFYN